MGGLGGLVKHITHSVNNAVKGIVKGVTKTFKAVGKAVTSFLQSDIGKIIIIGATIWLGGAALGYWASGFSSIDGALVAAQAATPAAEAATAAASTGAGATATDAAASAATGGLSTGAAAPVVAATPTGAGTAGIGAGAQAVDYAGAHAALTAAPAGSGGIMSGAGGALTGAAKWMAANPIPTLVAGSMLSSALSPNQMDVNAQNEQFRIDEEKRRQADIDAANARLSGVGSIPTMQYSGATLPPPTPPLPAVPGQPPQPAGIMGRQLLI